MAVFYTEQENLKYSHSYDASQEHEMLHWFLVGENIKTQQKLGARAVLNAYAKRVFLQESEQKMMMHMLILDVYTGVRSEILANFENFQPEALIPRWLLDTFMAF